jgi:hypothetical protein
MPKAKDFRRIVLRLPDTVESAHMGHPDFRVNGRIFATLNDDETRGMVVLTPDQQERFVRENPSVFQSESGAWGRAGCTRVHLASVDEETLGEALTLAWQNGVAKGPSRSTARAAAKPATAMPRSQSRKRKRPAR